MFLALALAGGTAAPLQAQRHERPQPQAASASENSTPEATSPEKRKEIRDENYEFSHSDAVKRFGAAMGLNADQAATAFEIFNFLILAVAVGYVLLKTLPKTFHARTTAIQKQLADARTATEEANARLNTVEARLSKLDEQIAGMRSQAEADSAREEHRIRASVEEEKSKILAAAESEIHTATAMARREIQQFAAELAIEQAARKLVVTAETDRLLVEGFVRKLAGEPGGQN
ncbi:MAG TPA: ATP synthase F0 subunit B [Acidobacteriaceae bacterium]|nr:ATP synthase F0 subunit B [Acidobacteriaceae bacterium]